MDKSLKVLVISDWYPNNFNPINGIFVHNQLSRLVDCGVDITVVSPVPWSSRFFSLMKRKWERYLKIDKKAEIDGIRVEYPRYLRPPGLWFYPYSGITCFLGIKKTVKNIYQRSPFDLIYTNALIPSGYAGCLLARKLNLPSVCYIGESDLGYLNFSKLSSERMRYVILNSSGLISVSKHERDRIREIAHPRKPIEVIYRGTNTNVFKPLNTNLELKRKLLLPDDSPVVTFVGHLIRRKGIHDLLNAFSLVTVKLPKAHLLIVGDGPERDNLEALSSRMGIRKRVIFAGLVRNEEIPSYYSITDVMAFPSYAEGLPNAVVEAIACGVPVVATNVGGIPEIITPSINGFLVEVGDIKNLSSNIIKMLTDEVLKKRMGRESRRIAEDRFNARDNAEKLKSFLSQIVEEYRGKFKTS
jgi:glycosyltransferase involved in cell wall biosynthesis